MYLFDYTIPINELLKKNEEICRNNYEEHDELWLYSWFFMMVNNGQYWDIKLSERWNEQLPKIHQYSKHFPFVFRNTVITAESLGNITYGYWGCCLNFTSDILLFGGDFASGGIDSDDDKQDILNGILYYCIDHDDYSKLPQYQT